jgi:hypothetical protein
VPDARRLHDPVLNQIEWARSILQLMCQLLLLQLPLESVQCGLHHRRPTILLQDVAVDQIRL